MREKIIFFGSGKYVVPIIDILNPNFDLELVITTEGDNNGPVFNYCRENNIEVYSISRFSQEVINTILSLNVKVAVLASFGMIIPNKVLDLFPLGIINIHPSLLPKFRGPTPVQTAIVAGQNTTGVSIIKLDPEVDHGPILAMADYPIAENDTGESLYNTLFKLGADLLIEVLPKYINGELTPTEQNHEEATFTDHLTRESGYIDINNPEDKQTIERKIRAYFPWPGVWFKAKLNGNEKVIKLLPENKVQVEGKNPMLIKDFANGYSEGREIIEKLNINERA